MLDTNIVSELIRDPGGRAAQRATQAGEVVCISTIMAAELRYGCVKAVSLPLLQRVGEFLSEVPVLPFGMLADRAYGAIRAELEAAGRPIGSNDLLIAAHARSLDATLVTANTREFQRVAGLKLENWMV